MNLALPLLLALSQAEGLQDWSFPVGTTWTYAMLDAGAEKTRVLKVVKVEGGRTHYEDKTFVKGKEKLDESRSFGHYVEKGFLMEARFEDGKPMFPSRVFKLGSKKGDSWTSTDEEEKPDVTHMGVTQIQVPGGIFREAIHLRLQMRTGTLDTWRVPGAGVVCEQLHFPPEKPDILQLLELKRGK